MLDVVTDTPWQIINDSKTDKNKNKVKSTKSDTTGFVVATGSVSVNMVRKESWM